MTWLSPVNTKPWPSSPWVRVLG